MCDKKRPLDCNLSNKENEPRIKIQMVQTPRFTNRSFHSSCPMLVNYTVIKAIGEGSYGWVYKGEEKLRKNVVALKQLKADKLKNFRYTNNRLREVDMCMKSKHPNVVNFIEVVHGSAFDGVFLVMEYVESDLAVLIRQKRVTKLTFSRIEKRDLMRQLFNGLDHMHNKQIVHRDLKPSNLLITNERVLKIADFGLARQLDPESSESYTPRPGTRAYQSPELLIDNSRYSVAIDLWAVGCIFGELYNLRPLFPAFPDLAHLNSIFKYVGYPTEKTWPDFFRQPISKMIEFEAESTRTIESVLELGSTTVELDLLEELLRLDSQQRISARLALKHDFIIN